MLGQLQTNSWIFNIVQIDFQLIPNESQQTVKKICVAASEDFVISIFPYSTELRIFVRPNLWKERKDNSVHWLFFICQK